MATFDFKSDLKAFTGQQEPQAPIGGSSTTIGGTDNIGGSPVKKAFSFQDDIKTFGESDRLENAPATEALQVENVLAVDKFNKEQEEQNRVKQAQIEASSIDPRDEIAVHARLAPTDQLTPTGNIEIDYVNDPLATKAITAVPEGTVGGHCGVYAENIVKLPGGGNWIVGDSIQEKSASIERYRKAGLAFIPGEEAPQVGNSFIQDTGSKWGHVAVINDIDENGVATITESNWKWDKRVTHQRKMRLDDPSIVGFIRTQ